MSAAVEAATVTVRVQNLVSNGAVNARSIDETLIAPWGIVTDPSSPISIANNGTGLSTLFSPIGARQTTTITVPDSSGTTVSNPTAIVFNTTDNFVVSGANGSGPAQLIFVNRDGTIAAWSPDVSAPSANSFATIVHDRGDNSPVFTGATMFTSGQQSRLFVTDFGNGQVLAFNDNFDQENLSSTAFRDPRIPSSFSPFNIMAVGNLLIVAYAQRDSTELDARSGRGKGYIDIFSLQGQLLRRLVRRGQLDAPWGMAVAPSNFGRFSNALLVANGGNGRINAFNLQTGRYLGTLRLRNNRPVEIDGLRGIAFGQGAGSGSRTTLFFTAAPTDANGDIGGLFGRIQPVATSSLEIPDDEGSQE
jgi:uncharacterized protein (TIGR03118 family)